MDMAYNWAKERNAIQLKVETQHNNVSACKFYASKNYILGTIDKHAYSGDPKDETMLIWYKLID